jgi:hypothetical protein
MVELVADVVDFSRVLKTFLTAIKLLFPDFADDPGMEALTNDLGLARVQNYEQAVGVAALSIPPDLTWLNGGEDLVVD